MTCANNSLGVDTATRYSQRVSFGKNLKRLRAQRQVAAKTVAAALGIKQGTYSDYERDRRGLPEGPTLLRFAKYFCVSLDELIVGIDAEYDALTRELRAELTHSWAVPAQTDLLSAEKDPSLTRSVIPGVENRETQPDNERGDIGDGYASVHASSRELDRAVAIEIERARLVIQRRAHALILSLYGYADAIRSVADDLLTPPRPQTPGTTRPADDRSDSSVRHRSARARRR